ncbi:RecQ family ATP-dependent DNA helicase [Frondihabitans peucedani]|uniref:ATP-dependent DNA helicase RecQ n=1 Tax=Frondihabitans peucedani TaxID=598626 RepID=A0ABP8E343_9MICO
MKNASTDRAAEIARTAAALFEWDDLRPAQFEAVEALLEGRDVVGLMPTGVGKSAIYQVAGAVMERLVVVVSPLIALQADQVAGLVGHPLAPKAIAINSGHTEAENDAGWEQLAAGSVTYVFLAPEQLASDATMDRLRSADVGLLVVDEAHCVSSWGHDFRPDYLHLGEIAEQLGRPPVLALTATGSEPIRDEIIERLRMNDPLVLSRGFDRPNLALSVVRHEEDHEKREAVVRDALSAQVPAIVYVATRRETTVYAAAISAERPDLRVVGYHGGQRSSERGQVHEAFHAGEIDIVVATSAFGMGIDKPDVRTVIHADVPDSLEEYYQEIGRAGRDGSPATAALHYRPEDLALRSFFASGLPGRADLRAVFTTVKAAGRPVGRTAVKDQLSLGKNAVSRLIDLLLEAGALSESRRGFSAVDSMTAEVAAASARDVAETRDRVEKSRIEMMRSFAEHPSRRRHFLLGYFGEDTPESCGNCDNCARVEAGTGQGVEERSDRQDAVPFQIHADVSHRVWGEGTVMSYEADRMTVFFKSEGYKVLALEAVAEHHLLEEVS